MPLVVTSQSTGLQFTSFKTETNKNLNNVHLTTSLHVHISHFCVLY